jgi:hypothetical protein
VHLDPKARDFVALVDALRSRGAQRVRWGDFEAELGPVPAAAAALPAEPSRQERERAEREDAERDLYWSTGGPVPAEAE